MNTIYTIGHSTLPIEDFVRLLQLHDITAICDVRSQPYSRVNSQFNRTNLERFVKKENIAYVFLGKELGARSEETNCYENGKVQYHILGDSELFREGIERLRRGIETYRIALMCAEKDPIECHRTILIGRKLVELNIGVKHILPQGKIESQTEALERLRLRLKLPESDLLRTHEEILMDAYRIQADRIAYTPPDATDTANHASGNLP